jgi:hypothetical protein
MSCSLINPFGWRVWEYFFSLNKFLAAFHDYILEFQATFTATQFVWALYILAIFYAVIILASLRLLFSKNTLAITSVGVAAIGIILMPISFRNIPFIFLFSVPMIRLYLDLYGDELVTGSRALGRWAPALCVALTLALSWMVVSSNYYHWAHRNQEFGTDLKDNVYANSISKALNDYQLPARIFNHSSDGGFLQFFNPKIIPYNDSRFTDVDLVGEYFEAINNPSRAWSLHRRHFFDGVLISFNYQEFAHFSISKDDSFVLGYADICHALFVRTGTPLAAFLNEKKWKIYSNEDLRMNPNAECLFRWAKSLNDYPNRRLLAQIISEMSASPRINAHLFLAFYDLSKSSSDFELMKQVKSWRSRLINADDPRLAQEIQKVDSDTESTSDHF